MSHSSESTWAVVSNEVAINARRALDATAAGEESYQDLLEDYATAGMTDQLYANQLFHGSPSGGPATVEEVAKVTDLVAAMTVIHDVWQCLNNVAIGAQDRATILRRMS